MMYVFRHYVLTGVLCAVFALAAPVVASANNSIDNSLVEIEQVSERIASTQNTAEDVLKYVSDQEGLKDKQAEELILSAVKAAFDAQGFTTEIRESLQQVPNPSIDADRLAKIADDLAINRQKIEAMQRGNDDVAMSGKVDRPHVDELATLMASPELAAESALTAQVIYAAIHAFFNPDQSQLTSLSPQQRQAMPTEIITYLRQKTENEKPYSKIAERANEKLRMSVALAGLSDDNLTFLLDFYQSPEGKAKREALVIAFQQASANADRKMLQMYFEQLADDFKTNPKIKSSN
jgi:hypothetical protein